MKKFLKSFRRFLGSLERLNLLRGLTSLNLTSLNSLKASLLIILVFSLFGVKALFHPGFYTSHDGEHQVLRLYHFDKAVRDGQIPPRWADDQILSGHGYPLFNFSYQAPWIMAEPLRLTGLSLVATVKAVFIFTFLLSGYTMFFWLKSLFGNFPALVGSILYLWAPYRFSNIFVRASLGEATAYMFSPLVFYGLEKIKEKEAFREVLIGGLGVAGLILSHALASFIFLFPILAYFFAVLLRSKTKAAYLKRALLLFLLGFSLSAYYLLPAFFEKKFTKFSQVYPSMFADHFVTLGQLIYSRWDYGFSFPGVENDGMAFQIGPAQWLSVFLAVSLVVGLLFLKRPKKLKDRVFLLGASFLLSFFFSLLMMLKASEPLWRLMARFVPFDFPWRFLGLAVFSSSFLAALTFFLLQKLKLRKIALFLSLFLAGLTFYANRNHLRVNQYIFLDDAHYEKITNSTSSYNELAPIWAKSEFFEKSGDLVEVLDGKVRVKNIKRRSDKISFSLENKDKDALLRVSIFYFPGWKLFVNGRLYQFDFNSSGMIEFRPPAGESYVQLILTKTPIRAAAELISFLTLILVALWSLKFQWR